MTHAHHSSTQAPNNPSRCHWCLASQQYMDYHDHEWGFPVADDFRLFEKLSLEGFQSGLSWRTILAKRENFREAFLGFDYNKVAQFTPDDVERLLQNAGIVRHRGKIEAVINNAQRTVELVKTEGSLAAYIWRFAPPLQPHPPTELISTSVESIALSKALKKQGWKFVGPTTMYAFMQAMGMVNDHTAHCYVRNLATEARKRFQVPCGSQST